MSSWGAAIAAEAKLWAGEWYARGVEAQCMNWVREVLHRVGHPAASQATKNPVDGQPPGLGFANSLCGRDMGTVILQVAELVPGDLLFWNDTYRGDWPSNTITHVGIYVGNGEIVHRPTMARPCERIRLAAYTAGVFRCGLRLFSPASGSTPPVAEAKAKRVLKIVAHSGKLRMQLDGKWSDLDSLEINADYQS